MSNKFEKLLDYLVNEEMDKANELFHEIVVEKSRTIYENLISEETQDEEEMDESREEDDEEEMDESREEDDEEMDESMIDETDFGHDSLGGDESDELVHDVEAPGTGDDLGGDSMGGDMDAPATKGDLFNLEQDLERLLADIAGKDDLDSDDTFGDESDDTFDDESDDTFGDEGEEESDDEGDEEWDDEEEDEEDDEEEMDEQFVREYRETVAKGNYNNFGKNSEEKVNTKSAINTNLAGRPDGGKASAKNIATGGKGSNEDGTKTNMGADGKSLAGAVKGKFTDGSMLNVDGKTTKGYDKSAKKPSKEQGVNSKDVLP